MNHALTSRLIADGALRQFLRVVRKSAKRFLSVCTCVRLLIRNLTSSQSVLGDTPVVVSLTSYGRRISSVALGIESIGRGAARPSRMILWLDDPDRFAARPKALRRLERRGLEVKLTENFGPHTKYFPYVRSLPLHRLPLVTADDDIIYPQRWLSDLHEAHLAHPQEVNCHWASVVTCMDGNITEYVRWPNCTSTLPRHAHIGLGVSGVIYPPRMLNALSSHGQAFLTRSPSADDIWLHWVALRSGIRVRQVSATPRHFSLIPRTQKLTLMRTNNATENDRWIRGLYTPTDVMLLAA